jgi:hypothetical protein
VRFIGETVAVSDQEPVAAETFYSSEWTEVDPEFGSEIFGFDDASFDIEGVLGLLLSVSATRPFLRVDPSRPTEAEAPLSYLVAGSRIFVNTKKARDLRGDLYAALAVWVLSHSLTWTAGVALFRKGAETLKLLDGDEREIVGALLKVSSARQAATVPVADLAAAMGTDSAALQDRLEAMAERGVLGVRDGGWRLNP